MKKYMIILSLLGTSLASAAAEIPAQPPEVTTIKSTAINREQLPGPAELVIQYRSHISKIATQYLQECIASGLYQQLSPQAQILMQKFSGFTWKKIDYKQDINVLGHSIKINKIHPSDLYALSMLTAHSKQQDRFFLI